LKIFSPFVRLHFCSLLKCGHPSWYTEETYAVSPAWNGALLAETERGNALEVLTADFLMFACDVKTTRQSNWRLGASRFDEWLRKGVNVYAYCKHEDAGKAPAYAHGLLSAAATETRKSPRTLSVP